MPKPSSRAVHAVMRALARAIDNLDLPAVEKIAEESQEDPFEVLIATMLSAQTRDAVTAAATARLFRVARTPRTIARLSEKQIVKLIYPVSFYRHKAAHVRETCRILVERFGGRVPSTMTELLALPGVGRKTANLVLILSFRASRTSASTRTSIGSRTASDGCGREPPTKPSRRCTRPPVRGGGRTSISISSLGARTSVGRTIRAARRA